MEAVKCTFCGNDDGGGRFVMTRIPDGDEIVCTICLRRAIDLLAHAKDSDVSLRSDAEEINRRDGPDEP